MNDLKLASSNKENNVVGFSIKQRKKGDCKHPTVLVDEFLGEIECETCGEKINPIQFLLRMAKQEINWKNDSERYETLKKEVDARVRCKCQHCGKMTRI